MEEFTPEQLEKMRAARREYMREYRKRPDVKQKMKNHRARYWLKKADELENKND